MVKINVKNYTYYPELTDNKFQEKIYNKKEFFEKPTNARKIKKAMAVKREKKRQATELGPRGPRSRRR